LFKPLTNAKDAYTRDIVYARCVWCALKMAFFLEMKICNKMVFHANR